MSATGLFRRCSMSLGIVAMIASSAYSNDQSNAVGDGRGVFVWFDSAVWSSTTDWFENPSPVPDCITTIDGDQYMLPRTTIIADSNGEGFSNLHDLVTDNDPSMPSGARLNNGNVFVIATSLDPTSEDEFRPWANLNSSHLPDCFDGVDHAKEVTFQAFYSYVKGMINSGDGSGSVPVSLMLSSPRTLRFGRLLSNKHHLDPHDSVYFGGKTQMNASANAPNLEFTTTEQESAAHCWSMTWPDNASTSAVDDVKLVLNYTKRCIEFAKYCNETGGLGSSPELDVYLDLELMQLSHTAASNNNISVGTSYPGMQDMPQACKDSAALPAPPNYWSVSANVADAFWRTLRMTRSLIDDYNNDPARQPDDVRLTLSVWSQEAYRFCSPRFGILDTMASPDSWDQSGTPQSNPTWGKFNQSFGTAKVYRRTGGTYDNPTFETESWQCDCARLDPSAGVGDAMYEMTTPEVDDFNINNCILQFADRVAYGTYQSVPASIQQPKKNWGKIDGRNDVAVDIIGHSMPAKEDDFAVLPGQGVPLGGYEMETPINFAKQSTFVTVPGSDQEWASWQARLSDGGWALYPPNFDDPQVPSTTWSRYYYNPIGAWPNPTGNDTATPDWSNFGPITECARYWGSFDMTHGGWVPFAARMLTQVDRWRVLNDVDVQDAPRIIMTLELTPLSSAQAGAGGGACFKNSYGNQWVWGDESGTTACASGMKPAGSNFDWPNVMIDSMCQDDRVLYLFGSDDPDKMNASNDVKIGSAWGLAPASALFSSTMAPSGTPLSTYLDSKTPYAFNNHLSYHCLMTHQTMSGFYVTIPEPHKVPYAVDPTTGARSCWSPYGLSPQNNKPLFGGCTCPAATMFQMPTALDYLILGTPGDTTGDNQSDIEDLLKVLALWGSECDAPCVFDHNGDRIIDVSDLLGVIEGFGSDWN